VLLSVGLGVEVLSTAFASEDLGRDMLLIYMTFADAFRAHVLIADDAGIRYHPCILL